MGRFVLSPRSAAALLLIGLASCGADLTLPDTTAAGLDLAVVDGDGQVGTVGQALRDPIVVEVKTEAGAPMAGRRVAFLASGGGPEGFDPDTAVTNSEGQALAFWVLGPATGTYTGQARIVVAGDTTAEPVSFQADALAGDPDTVRAAGPTSQPGRRGQLLADSLSVMVVDRFGNPVGGAGVEWKVKDGGDGELSQEEGLTGADGISSVTWTLGNSAGLQKVEAKVDQAAGSPVAFTAVVLF